MNTLVLGPGTICVEAHELEYMNQLDKMGIEAIPVPYEHVVPYGGSLHRTTFDIYRESDKAVYFPNQQPNQLKQTPASWTSPCLQLSGSKR